MATKIPGETETGANRFAAPRSPQTLASHWLESSGTFLQPRPSRAPCPNLKLRMVLRFRWLQEIGPGLRSSLQSPSHSTALVKRAKKKGVSTFTVWWGNCYAQTITRCCTRRNGFGSASSGGARVDVRQYDRSLAGADYVCKCLGANAYELSKYSFANSVTLSASVIRLIAGIDASGERRGGDGHMEKRGGARDGWRRRWPGTRFAMTPSATAGMLHLLRPKRGNTPTV